MEMQKNTLLNNYLFFMSDNNNPPAGKTGLNPSVTISRDGGAFGAATNSPTEIGNGWYKINLTAGDLNGDSIIIKASAAGAYDWNDVRYLTANTEAQIYAAVGAIPTNPLLASNYTAPDNSDIAAIKAKTDNLPSSPAATGAAMTLTSAYDAAKSAASQSSVNAIPTNPLLTTDSRLNNLDAAISGVAAAVWAAATRTLSGAVDILQTAADKVWGSATRALTAGVTVSTNNDKTGYSISGTKQTLDALNDITAASVWAVATRTLTSFGTLASDTATAVWGAATRTLTSFGTLASDIWSYATRLLTGAVNINSNSDITAIKGKTDNLPADTNAATAFLAC